MEIKFKQGMDENQEFLFPKNLSEYLPDSHLAKAIAEIVETLDLSDIVSEYSPIGQHAYDPKMMVSLLFYGYSIGVRSSRKIAKGCEERFDFVFLSRGLRPSHDRISDFRKENVEELKNLFRMIVVIGSNLGLVKIGNINVAIDGAKLKANASSKLTKDEDGLFKLLIDTDNEITKIMEEVGRIDDEEDKKYGKKNRGDELPKELCSRLARKMAIEKALEKLRIQKEEMRRNIKEQLERQPTGTEEKEINKMKINTTDNDAKFMRERNGLIRPGYNCQISVDEENQFIVANEVTMDSNDAHKLVDMLEMTEKNVGENPKSAKADNDYFSELELVRESFPEVDLYVDDKNRRKEKLDMKEIKKGYSKEQYENLKKLLTKKGEEEYKKRMYTAEPPFGNLKHNLGYGYFLLRELEKNQGEFDLMCIGHNIRKIHSFMVKNNQGIAGAMRDIVKMRGLGGNIGGNSEGKRQSLAIFN